MPEITQTFTRLIQTGTTSASILLPNRARIINAKICFGAVNAAAGSSAVALAEINFSSITGYIATATLTDRLVCLAVGIPSAAAATDSLAVTQTVDQNVNIPIPGGATLLCQVSSVSTGYSVYFQVTVALT